MRGLLNGGAARKRADESRDKSPRPTVLEFSKDVSWRAGAVKMQPGARKLPYLVSADIIFGISLRKLHWFRGPRLDGSSVSVMLTVPTQPVRAALAKYKWERYRSVMEGSYRRFQDSRPLALPQESPEPSRDMPGAHTASPPSCECGGLIAPALATVLLRAHRAGAALANGLALCC